MMLREQIDSLERRYIRLLERKEAAERKATELQAELERKKEEGNDLVEAKTVLTEAAKQTQTRIQVHISGIVSKALASVFDDPYEMSVQFVEKRGKTECELTFVKDDEQFDPMTSTGGGVVDVAAFALRIALWRLTTKRTNPVFIFDEPFKFLSVSLQPRAASVLQSLSERLGVQIIYVTHSPALAEIAETRYELEP